MLAQWMLLQSLFFLAVSSALASGCPDMSAFYPADDPDWAELQADLSEHFDQCLTSSEFFALLGAAELNLGNLEGAIQALERALLLDPDNGSALIDYGEALFQDGQLFASLEISGLLEDRDDLPERLRDQLVERRRRWQSLTRQTNWQLELGGGMDSNLNGAPSDNSIALTLSGEPVYLALNDEYRSIRGPVLSVGFYGEHARLAPDVQRRLSGALRGRFNKSNAPDIGQLTGRYSQIKEYRRFNIVQGTGLSHLSFAGQKLFTGIDLTARVEAKRGSSYCSEYVKGALQKQVWHSQRLLDGVELKAGAGSYCEFGPESIAVELNAIGNLERNDNRLGGNRAGWQALGRWLRPISSGAIVAQLEFASILDERGYSPLLSDNARRRIERSSASVQYNRPIYLMHGDADIFVNLYYQTQKSNLGLFNISDTEITVGMRLSF